MQKIVGVFVLSSLVSVVAAAESFSIKINSDDVLKIQTGPQHSASATVRDLEERIYRLERAVSQLQNEVFRLSETPRKAEKEVSCYIKTTFKGTFTGNGKTQNEAKGKALKACGDGGSMFCDENDVKCDV